MTDSKLVENAWRNIMFGNSVHNNSLFSHIEIRSRSGVLLSLQDLVIMTQTRHDKSKKRRCDEMDVDEKNE